MSSTKIFSNLLHEIVTKQQWYSKVFNPNIVQTWRNEWLEQKPDSADLFDLVLGFAQASAQGKIQNACCPWIENECLCKECEVEYEKKIRADPAQYDLTIEEAEKLIADEYWPAELDLRCEHPRCSCVPPDYELTKYISYHPTGVLSKNLHKTLRNEVRKMLQVEPINWHPGSNERVRDLVHPSLYCYVRGTSVLTDGTKTEEGSEETRYQWLPSEFFVSNTRKVEIQSYINNLDFNKYSNMIKLIERTFKSFLKSLESVLKQSLRSKILQVIVKIGTINLDATKPDYPGGSWHIEGMPYEHIAATCIHYLDVEGITDSFLEFRKPVLVNKYENYPQNDELYTTHHFGIEENSHHEGTMNRYLGLIKCQTGASIIFPNTLQHRVCEFSLVGVSGVRTILALFVINPTKRIVSTLNVAPQQHIFTREEAEHHRERLMYHRKWFIDTLNKKIFERPYSLCEH